MDFENNCAKTNKSSPILSAADMFSMSSSFWRYNKSYKVYRPTDIHGVSPNFYENLLEIYYT